MTSINTAAVEGRIDVVNQCLEFGFCVVFSDDQLACYETVLGVWLLRCVQ